jgi:transcriptional regulator with XRE-family HTH domain
VDLREIRKSLNLSMQKFADELGVSKMFVYYIENGKRGVSIDTALRIQKFLKDKGINVKLEDLYKERAEKFLFAKKGRYKDKLNI